MTIPVPVAPAVTDRGNESPPHRNLTAWILAKAGIAPDLYRPDAITRRIPACLRALKAQTEDRALELLETRPELLPRAVSAMLIGTTDFMRDSRVFDEFRDTVVPELSARRADVRIWSAACSSGPELYSVAILLAEAGFLERCYLLGTDCRADAIAEATRGSYPRTSLASLSDAARSKYFERADDGWRVAAQVRERVRWKVADLWTSTEEGPWDVILWRNVSIYMNLQPAAHVLSRLVGSLRPGGVLVVGKAERPQHEGALVLVSPCIYRKRGADHAGSSDHAGS